LARFCTTLGILWLLALASAAVAGPGNVTVVPFESAIARYEFFAEGVNDIPTEVAQLDYDDSGWQVGNAPFGTSSGECDVGYIGTPWNPTVDGSIVIRVWFELPDSVSAVYVGLRNNNSARLFMNGNWFSTSVCTTPSCPWFERSINVWSGIGWHAGSNLLTVMASSDFTFTYLDIEISADAPTTANEEGTWGKIKLLFQ